MREVDPEELKRMNGKDGNPVWVVFREKVYDVSQSKVWETGVHMARHASGQDLTREIGPAPHGPEVLDKFPQIGVFRGHPPSARVKEIPAFLQNLVARYPFLRRDPHPMTVHFPIAFLMATALFLILYFTTRNHSFEMTSFYMLCLGVLVSPGAIVTGLFTWWVNYGAVPTPYVKYKISLSMILCLVVGILVIWRYLDPVLIIQWGTLWWIYAILVFSLVPLVTLLGHFGGKMVFPA
jgi:predicted heme/steroid binding protein/uncharacterized membrane protein